MGAIRRPLRRNGSQRGTVIGNVAFGVELSTKASRACRELAIGKCQDNVNPLAQLDKAAILIKTCINNNNTTTTATATRDWIELGYSKGAEQYDSDGARLPLGATEHESSAEPEAGRHGREKREMQKDQAKQSEKGAKKQLAGATEVGSKRPRHAQAQALETGQRRCLDGTRSTCNFWGRF